MAKTFPIALAAASLLLPSIATAHPRISAQPLRSAHAPSVQPVAFSDAEPRVRIREADKGDGLTPLAFAHWLKRNPAILAARDNVPSVRLASSAGLLNRTALTFAVADADGDGRVSPVELADFLQLPPYSIADRHS